MSAKWKLHLLWRISAFIALGGWTTALGICSAHCALGQSGHIGETTSESLPPCHGGPVSSDSDSSSGTATSFCFTIKSLSFHVESVLLNAPTAEALLQPSFADLSAAPLTVAPAQLSRQSRPPDFVFTPEVSLGPAFRSHAPPLL
jgi:hypothetical protein